MRIVLAFDSFKGCITASEACDVAARGILTAKPDAEVIEVPLSDGGEGLVSCVRMMLPTSTVSIEVHGPLMEKVVADYALSSDGKTAYMEMAAASGLTLVPQDKRNPMLTTTYGVGEMITDAIRRGCKHIIMGIGGSATCDGGRGMVEALRDNNILNKPYKLTVACDVTNPLYGENGAAHIFAPQKGATPEQVLILDEQLRSFARETEAAGVATPALVDYPGVGAAGGLGYALLAYLKGELHSGIDIVLDLARFDEAIYDADLVITGEGRSDPQTLMGKVPHGVLKRCQKAGVPIWLISGAIDDASGSLANAFDLVKSINERDTRNLEELIKPDVANENMRKTMTRLFNKK